MDPLGKPVGGDDHGSGVGLSGGYGQPNAQNTQAGMMAANEKTGFNAGVGGAHASGGLPGQQFGSTEGAHPIADKFMSGSTGAGQGKLDNSLDNFGGNAGAAGAGAGIGAAAGAGAAGLTNVGATRGQDDSAVSGAYEGGEARDALTGQSRAFETSQGVGYGGENLSGGDGAAGTGHAYGTGVGAEGGAGGHYDPETAGSGKAAGIGVGAAGVGAAGAGAGALAGSGGSSTSSGNKQGHYGTEETDFDRGAPLSDPKQLDTGGPHSLVHDPATGKYIHRHEKEGGALADEEARPE